MIWNNSIADFKKKLLRTPVREYLSGVRYVFHHLPKTGGISIKVYLDGLTKRILKKSPAQMSVLFIGMHDHSNYDEYYLEKFIVDVIQLKLNKPFSRFQSIVSMCNDFSNQAIRAL